MEQGIHLVPGPVDGRRGLGFRLDADMLQFR